LVTTDYEKKKEKAMAAFSYKGTYH